MKNFCLQSKKPAGAASILVTIILSIIVVGMIAGITLLSNQENRQASNTDQSNRALNAAQSKIQSLADQLKVDPSLEKTTCQNDSIGDSSQDMQITCWTIKNTDSVLADKINADKSIQIDLGKTEDSAKKVSNIKLEWGLKGTDSDYPGSPPSPLYPRSDAYGARPATLELTFVWYGTKGSSNQFSASDFSDGSLPMQTIVISPDATHCSAAATGYQCNLSDSLASLTGQGGVENKNVILRITARYADANYSISFSDSSNRAVSLHLPKATIDVTARSGQTYRRIQATKALDYSIFNFAANVLYSGKDLCKNLKVYSDHTGAPATDSNAGRNNCP